MDDENPFQCYVCGVDVTGDRDRILANGRAAPRNFSWTVRCSVEEFDRIVFRNQQVWGTFIRAILITLDANNQPVYKLSGIAQHSHSIYTRVPRDKDLAVLGYPQIRGRACKFVNARISLTGYPRAHMIHARCWDLVERIFGLEAATVTEENVKILLNIFQERWKEDDIGKIACYDFLREDLLWRSSPITSHDPVKILPLRAVVEESLQRGGTACREKDGCKTVEPRPIFLDIKRTAVSDILPCEIQCMILDLLNYKDIPHILRAFGWILPNAYWSRRFPKDLVFEVDDMTQSSQEEIDWPFLTLGVEKLLECSPGLLNRRRLLPVLRKARDFFLKEVQAQQCGQTAIKS